jgi:protein phosphatase
MGLHASGITDRGPVRSTNEDCFACDARHGFCVVADGMGGHNAGEVAAQLAVDEVSACVRGWTEGAGWPFGFDASVSLAANVLRTAVHLANRRIFEAAAGTAACAGMGTTIVAVLVRSGRIAIAHVGDSRLYLFRDGKLDLLTRDDSWGVNRHVLTSVLGTRPRVEVHLADEPLAAGGLAILTTDGIHGTLDDAFIERLVAAGGEPVEIAGRLVRTAVGSGSSDNCTAVVLAASMAIAPAVSGPGARPATPGALQASN